MEGVLGQHVAIIWNIVEGLPEPEAKDTAASLGSNRSRPGAAIRA